MVLGSRGSSIDIISIRDAIDLLMRETTNWLLVDWVFGSTCCLLERFSQSLLLRKRPGSVDLLDHNL